MNKILLLSRGKKIGHSDGRLNNTLHDFAKDLPIVRAESGYIRYDIGKLKKLQSKTREPPTFASSKKKTIKI